MFSPYTLSSEVIGVVVGEMVDRSDLVPAALSQDVLTVFQFYGYISQHEVRDMETHLQHLAREGMSRKNPPARGKGLLLVDTVCVRLVLRCVR